MSRVFLLLLALLQGRPDPDGNCPVNIEGRLVFPAYATPIFHVSVVAHKLTGAPYPGKAACYPDPDCIREVFSGPDGFFQFGYAQSGQAYELVFQPEGMEVVQQPFVIPANHSPGGCFPTPGIHLDVLLHPLIKPSAITEDAVDIEDLERRIPEQAVKAFEKSMDKGSKTAPTEMSASLLDVLKAAPDYYEANLELGLEYKKQDQRDDAIRTLNHALDLNSGSMLARSALGQYSYEAGDFKKAADLLSEAARLGSKSSGVYYMLGTSYFRLGQLDLAEASLLRALAIVPSVVKAHMQLYNVYMKRQQPDKALKEADTYLEQYPDAPDREYVRSMADKLRKNLKPQP